MAVDEPSCSEIAINPAGSDRLDTEQIKVAIKVELDEGDEADDGGGAKTDARSLAEQQAREHMQRMIREAEEQTREELERKAARAKMRDAEIASLTASLTVIEARNEGTLTAAAPVASAPPGAGAAAPRSGGGGGAPAAATSSERSDADSNAEAAAAPSTASATPTLTPAAEEVMHAIAQQRISAAVDLDGAADEPPLVVPYSELARTGYTPEGVDPASKEDFLSHVEFQQVFAMGRKQFKSLPRWKREGLKKKANLF